MCSLAARVAEMIRIDAVWLATEPMDMRAGTDTALARVVNVNMFSLGAYDGLSLGAPLEC